MRRYLGILMTLVIAPAISFASGAETYADKEKAAVIKTIHTSIKWCFPDKSRERLYGSVVNDSTYFMFQPDSRATINGFKAFEAFAERVFMVDECKPIGSEIRELRVIFSRSGDVAWFSCLLDDWGEWAGEPWRWENTRWSGVLEKIDGKWLMMQQHFSFAEDAVKAALDKSIEEKETGQ